MFFGVPIVSVVFVLFWVEGFMTVYISIHVSNFSLSFVIFPCVYTVGGCSGAVVRLGGRGWWSGDFVSTGLVVFSL